MSGFYDATGTYTVPSILSANRKVENFADDNVKQWNVTWSNLQGTPSNLVGNYVVNGNSVFFTYSTGTSTDNIVITGNSTSFNLPVQIRTGTNAGLSTVCSNTSNVVGGIIWTDSSAYPGSCTITNGTPVTFSGTYLI